MEDAGRSFDETAIWEYCWRDSHNYRWGRFRRGDQCFHWQYKVRALVSNAARALSIPPSRANNQTAEPEMPLMRCLRESSPMGVSTFILIFFFKRKHCDRKSTATILLPYRALTTGVSRTLSKHPRGVQRMRIPPTCRLSCEACCWTVLLTLCHTLQSS